MKTLEIYDFYYSAECEDIFRKDAYRNHKVYVISLFKGIQYTEMIISGNKPLTSWANDLVKVGTGHAIDITYKN